jgi:nucleotide-binding universal stress UspA family protein
MRAILAAVDLSSVTHGVIGAAAAECREAGGVVHLLHVSTRSEALGEFEWESEQLEVLAASLRLEGPNALARVTHGDPAEEILAEIGRLKPALVVVGSPGHRALSDVVVGGVAEALLRQSPCPLLIVPASGAPAKQEKRDGYIYSRWV